MSDSAHKIIDHVNTHKHNVQLYQQTLYASSYICHTYIANLRMHSQLWDHVLPLHNFNMHSLRWLQTSGWYKQMVDSCSTARPALYLATDDTASQQYWHPCQDRWYKKYTLWPQILFPWQLVLLVCHWNHNRNKVWEFQKTLQWSCSYLLIKTAFCCHLSKQHR